MIETELEWLSDTAGLYQSYPDAKTKPRYCDTKIVTNMELGFLSYEANACVECYILIILIHNISFIRFMVNVA